jgi:SAM-dependent methyltransferase
MISRGLISELHCPYCGSGLEMEPPVVGNCEDIRYGVVRCACYRYPIVEGILILRQDSAPADTRDKRVHALDVHDAALALRQALASSPVRRAQGRWERARGVLQRLGLGRTPAGRVAEPGGDASMDLQQALAQLRPVLYGQYLFHRFANPSFLAGIAPLLLMRGLAEAAAPAPAAIRVLDLACGIGHSSFVLTRTSPGISVVATDHDFVNLYLARQHVVPDATHVCIDAELPLPFPDGFFHGVVAMDALHYVRSKVALLNELDRVVASLGLWIFAHVHNASGSNVNAGIPLSYEHYRRCFEIRPCRIFREEDILRDLIVKQSLDLTRTISDQALHDAPVLSVIGSARAETWQLHEGITEALCQTDRGLGVNPIYQLLRVGPRVVAHMKWPSRTVEAECAAVKAYLPDRWEIDAGLLNRLRTGDTTPDDGPTIASLAKLFRLVPLPRGYDHGLDPRRN